MSEQPANCFTTSDDLQLHFVYQDPLIQPKFTLAVVHGLGEHIGRYQWFSEQILTEGGSYAGLDLRGHGLSEGPSGHTPDYSQLLDDLDRFMQRARTPGRPLFLFGHSLGGGLVLRYALEQRGNLDGVIAASPLLKLAFSPPAWKLSLARRLARLKPDFSLDRGVKVETLSRDKQVRMAYKMDPLNHERVSAAMTMGFLENGEWCLQHAGALNTPCLLMHGQHDQVTDWRASEAFSESCSRAQMHLYADCYHELVNEPEREQVVADLMHWIDLQLAAG